MIGFTAAARRRRSEIWRNYPVGDKVQLVERLLNRGLLNDPSRAITANRQPGRCCDTGCTPPSPTTMVKMPLVAKRPPVILSEAKDPGGRDELLR